MLIDTNLPLSEATARPGGCLSCRYLGHHLGVAVWCGRPGTEHVRFQAGRGCMYWEREASADTQAGKEAPHTVAKTSVNH